MSARLEYKQEFESIILNNNSEEALKSLVPDTLPYLYVKFNNEFKKCAIEKKVSPDLIEILNQMNAIKGTELFRECELKRVLIEYDFPSTTEQRKKEIIDSLFTKFVNTKLDYPRPDIATNISLGTEATKYPTVLTDEMINGSIKKRISINTTDPLFQFKQTNVGKRHLLLESMETFHDDYEKIFTEKIPLPFSLLSDKTLEALMNCLKKKNLNMTNYFPFDQFSIKQLEKINQLLDEKILSKDTLMDSIIKKKYLSELKRLEGNDEHQRKVLIEILNFAKQFPQSKQYCAGILLLILQKGININFYDLELFKEFLTNPIRSRYFLPTIPTYFQSITFGNISINPSTSNDVIENYLQYFFMNDKATVKDFEKYFNLKEIQFEEMKAKLLKGEIVPREPSIMPNDEYDSICKRIELSLCQHNKETFAIDEAVVIDIDIKNIPVLYAKIFEINTENFYMINQSPITSLINIEGLVTKMEDVYSFNENPQKLIRKRITFDKIPKRRGVFIIELMGNGISARIIIKKGNLSIISRSSGKGKLCYVLDEKHEICKGNTGLWFRGSKYACDKDNGLIVIPYQSNSGNSTAILFTDSFCDIAYLDIPIESYELKGQFHLNHESIMTGNIAKVIFKPMLIINGRETLLSYMKKPVITVTMIKEENSISIPIITKVDSFQELEGIDRNKQLEFEIQIPSQLVSIQFLFECEVFNYSKRKTDNISLSRSITVDNVNSHINCFFLRKTYQKNYILSLLGKNGEARDDEMAKLVLSFKDLDLHIEETMETNDKGEINLGPLKDVKYITATCTVNPVCQKFIINDSDRFSYSNLIDTIKGQKIILPYQGKESDIHLMKIIDINDQTHIVEVISLTKDNFVLEKLKTPTDDDYQLTITNLDIGRYALTLNTNLISIEIHDGKYWTEGQNFIITDTKLIENSTYQTPLFINELQLEEKSIKFKTQSLSKNIRANVYLFQYLPQSIHYFPNLIKTMIQSTQDASEQTYQQWKNIYLSNRTINEEIQYVLDRKNYEQFMGNSLEMPSLLLKRQFTKESTLDKETIDQGSHYERKQAELNSQINQKKLDVRTAEEEPASFSVSDYQNFIMQLPFTQLALKANEETGEIKVDLPSPIEHWGHCHIICFDDKSICSKMFQINTQGKETQKRSLTLDKPLDNEKNYTEIRKTELVMKDNTITISELSNYKIIDSVTTAVNYILVKNPNYAKEWNEIAFLIENITDEEVIMKKLSNNISHEVNIFFYFKYPELFDKYIKPILKYKFEKTFIDYFLLDDKDVVKRYLTVESISKLNVFELCLFILKIGDEMPEEAKKIRNVIKMRVKTDDIQAIITTNFDILMNMKIKKQAMDDLDQRLLGVEKQVQSQKINAVSIRKACPRMGRPISHGRRGRKHGSIPKQEEICNMEESVEDICYDMDESVEELNDCSSKLDKLTEKSSELKMQAESISKKKKMCQADVFSRAESSRQRIEPQLVKRPVEFDKPGGAKEYKERHYLFKEHKIPLTSPFWLEFADHVLNKKTNNKFLSKHLLYNESSINEIVWILSVLDLPITNSKHIFNRVEQRRIEITASSNLMLFTKEISEGSIELNKNLIISQNIREYNKNDSIDTPIYKKNTVYTHETIVTNISSSKIQFELFIQIPQGALPMHKSYYTQTKTMTLNSYITTSYLTHFYFPNEGVFLQYHPVATIENKIISKGKEMTYKVQSKKTYQPSSNDNNKLEVIIANGNTKDIAEYFKTEPIDYKNIRLILWLLKDKEFYASLISILRNRGLFNREIWNFGFYHYDEQAIKEILNSQQYIRSIVGMQFESKLLTVNKISNYTIINHFEYAPLFNARTHLFGKNSSSIMNNEFKETYQKFIISLLSQPILDTKSLLRLTYYLILQDRIDEAVKVFERVKIDQQKDNYNFDSLVIQYDYINAYLDFSIGFPKFSIARTNCIKYKQFPIAFWRELFEEIEDQLIEYDGKSKVSSLINAESNNQNQTNMKQFKKDARSSIPNLTFKIENKQLKIIHSNISEIGIKFYLIDLEILFSRNPFLSSHSSDFSFIKPNYSTTIKCDISKEQGIDMKTLFDIPQEFISKNIFIEVSSEPFKLFETYFSSDIQVVISESLGELKVCDNNLVPLTRVYIKCFAKMNNSSVKFYKDGYTDLRGLFNYLALNTNELKSIVKLSLFISHDEKGCVIKECSPPYNLDRNGKEGEDFDSLQKYKQKQRTQWRLENK